MPLFNKSLILMVVLAAGALGLALIPGMTWTGSTWKAVRVRITQAGEHTPLSGAKVVLLREDEAKDWLALGAAERERCLNEWIDRKIACVTGADGQAMLRSHFPAGGQNSILLRGGSFGITGLVLVICEGRVLAQRRLEELMACEKYSLNDELPMIALELP